MGGGDAADVSQRLSIALTIAGSDSGGGAGIQADLKTFAALGVYGASVVTALTAQNTRGVQAVHYPPPGIVAKQIEAVLEDFDVAAIKIGMLGSAEIAGVVAERLPSPDRAFGRTPVSRRAIGRGAGGEGSSGRYSTRRLDPSSGASRHLLPEGEGRQAFIIYDPVMTASSGHALSGAGFVETIRAGLLPLVDCLAPNLAEAAALLGEPVARSEAEMARQGEALLKLGSRAILMKGGHLDGDEAIDLLVTGGALHRFAAPKIDSSNLHGTGCVLSSAVAAHVMRGAPLAEAVERAKAFVRQAIVAAGQGPKLGAGPGPLRPDLVARIP
jgi:hydroxymethylpyrimidine/phosphomethylpyrimidine kinase